ncbi:MAG TPA: class III poly(R)-hydroxyalkanoic acid synthase subunit PhaE [Dokdonella sp.]
MGQSPSPDWMNQWQDLSRNYLNAWQTMSRNPAAMPGVAASPWPEGFEQWSRLFASGGGTQNETVDRVIDSAKGYAAFMQSLLGAAGNGASMPSWSELFRPGFGIPGVDAASFEHPMLRALREMQGQTGQGFGNGFAQAFGALNAFRGAPPMPSADFGELKAWLSLPAFGLMREHQEHHQKTAVAWIEYQEQMSRYNALMLKASQRGFELFEGKLSEREQPGRQIESLRALYDLWVDAAEEGYAEIALSQEFREIYGALVNAQMRVRAQVQQDVERVAAGLGMPTRSEVDSIGERLQALRREVRQRSGGESASRSLAREVASLRSELAALKAAVGKETRTAPAPVAAAKPRAQSKSKAVPKADAKPKPAAKVVAITKPTPTPKVAAIEPDPAPMRAAPTHRKPRKAKRERAAKRAVAATSTFASRIAKFADASLGASRPHALRKKKQAKADKAKKKR